MFRTSNKSDSDFNYRLLDLELSEKKRAEPKEEEKPQGALSSIPSDLIIEGILPFLRSKDRISLSSTARAFQHIDSELQRIHLLQQWENLIESEAKKVDWKKLIISPRALYSSIGTLAVAGSSTALYFSVKCVTS